jgi:dihydrofolate reductase
MRKLIVSEFITLDGVMQAPGGADEDTEGGFTHGGWTMPYWHDDIGAHFGEALGQTDTFLLGRKTWQIHGTAFEAMAGDPFADMLNAKQKYVVSTTLKDVSAWRNSTLISGNVVEEVRKLKEQPGKNIVVLGSGELVQTLMQNDLVDEYGLMINPILLGSGKRLFREGSAKLPLKLVRSMTTSTGVIVATYEPERS